MEPGDEVNRLSYVFEAQRAIPDQEAFSDHEESSDYSDGADDAPVVTRRRVYDPGNTRRRRRRPAWSRLEEAILAKQHSIRGNSWSAIAEHLPGRSASEVKNIWHSTLRSKKLKSRSLLRAYARCLNERGDSASARQEAFRAAVKFSRGVGDILPAPAAGKQPSGSDDDEYGVLHAANPPCSGSSDGGCAASITSHPSSPNRSALPAGLAGGENGNARVRTAPPLPGAPGSSGVADRPTQKSAPDPGAAAAATAGQRHQRRGRGNQLDEDKELAALLGLDDDGDGLPAAGDAGDGEGVGGGADPTQRPIMGADPTQRPVSVAAKATAQTHRSKSASATAAEPRDAIAVAAEPVRVSQRQPQRRQRQKQHQQRDTGGAEEEGGEEGEEGDDDDEGDGGRRGRYKRSSAGRGNPQQALLQLQGLQLPEDHDAPQRLAELQLLCLQAARQRAQVSALEALPPWTRRRLLEEETQAEAYRFLLRQHLLQRATGHPLELAGAVEGVEAGSGSEVWRLQEEGGGGPRPRGSLLERVQPGAWGVPPLQAIGMWDRLAPLAAAGPLSAAAAAAGLPGGPPPREFLAAQLGHLDSLSPLAAAMAANNAAAVGDMAAVNPLNPLNPLCPLNPLGGLAGAGGLGGLDPLDVTGRLGCGLPGSNMDVMDQLNMLLDRINADRMLNERLAAAAATQAAAAQAAAAQVAAMQAAAAQAAAMQAAAMRFAGLPPGARGPLPQELGGLAGVAGADALASMSLLPQLDAPFGDNKPFERSAMAAAVGPSARPGGGRRRVGVRDGSGRAASAAKQEDLSADGANANGVGPLHDGGDRLALIVPRGGRAAAWQEGQREQGEAEQQQEEQDEGTDGLHSLAGAAAAAAAALGPTPRAAGARRRNGPRDVGSAGTAAADRDGRKATAQRIGAGEAEAEAGGDGSPWRRQEDALDHFAAAALLHSGFGDLGAGLKGRRLKNPPPPAEAARELDTASGAAVGPRSCGQRPPQPQPSGPSRQQPQRQETQERRSTTKVEDMAEAEEAAQQQEHQQMPQQLPPAALLLLAHHHQQQQLHLQLQLQQLQQLQQQQQEQQQSSAGVKRPRERHSEGRSPARGGGASGGAKSARMAPTR